MELIFELSSPGRGASAQHPPVAADLSAVPEALRRKVPPRLPEVSELQAVRHYTRLSRLNFSIDTQFYPLGSCTMKYNPRACNKLAMLPEFLGRHPLAPEAHSQGYLACLFELQEMLRDVTGMAAVSLTPMAGAQGEFAGVAMIRAYHRARGDDARREILVPDAAHGTNPATATMLGYVTREIPTNAQGDVDIGKLKAAVGPQTAGIMLTNPSTLGVFERSIKEIAGIVHAAGGLLYYDGANLNAILGKVRPGDMGFDVIHMNLHKTFSTPHGGGGPGSGPVVLSEALTPFAPLPFVEKQGDQFVLVEEESAGEHHGQSFGRMTAFHGQMGMFTRAMSYILSHGADGLRQVAEDAVLNANYILRSLEDVLDAPFGQSGPCMHEALFSDKGFAEGLTTLDLAKALIDEGYHPMTMYFPLVVHGAMLIEPTETESKATLDQFIGALRSVAEQAKAGDQSLKAAPVHAPRRRLDETQAARKPVLVYKEPEQAQAAE